MTTSIWDDKILYETFLTLLEAHWDSWVKSPGKQAKEFKERFFSDDDRITSNVLVNKVYNKSRGS